MIGAEHGVYTGGSQENPCIRRSNLGLGQLGFRDDTLFYSQMLVAGFKIAAVPHSVVEHNFEPSRLTAKSWIKNAVSSGNSSAYMSHHWQHDTVDRSGDAGDALEDAVGDFSSHTSPEEIASTQKAATRFELKAVENVTFYQAIRKIASELRHYDRLGLVKKSGNI